MARSGFSILTYHVRRRLRRARGNQFYRDRSYRGMGTFCGANETQHDRDWAERNRVKPWRAPNGMLQTPCEACVKAIAKEAKPATTQHGRAARGDTYDLIGKLARKVSDRLTRKQVAWIKDVAQRERQQHEGPAVDGTIFYEDHGIAAKDARGGVHRGIHVYRNGAGFRNF